MRISLQKAEECLTTYVNNEICPKLNDWRKWAVPVMFGYSLPSLEKTYIDNKPLLETVGFVDKEGLIDIDLIYDKFHKVAEESGDITQEIPMLGTLKLSVRDIESLYRIIRSSSI